MNLNLSGYQNSTRFKIIINHTDSSLYSKTEEKTFINEIHKLVQEGQENYLPLVLKIVENILKEIPDMSKQDEFKTFVHDLSEETWKTHLIQCDISNHEIPEIIQTDCSKGCSNCDHNTLCTTDIEDLY
mgnify:CR=1 FL=1